MDRGFSPRSAVPALTAPNSLGFSWPEVGRLRIADETHATKVENSPVSFPFRLIPEAVRCATCTDKRAILAELEQGFASAYSLEDDVVLEALREREALGSTGFGRGVAMPHARMDTIDQPLAMLIHLDQDVEFDAADGAPVRLVMGLVSPSDAGARHLHALAAMSRLTRDERVLHSLFEAQSEEELFAIVANADLRDAA